jgi:hypothetical protein
MKHTSESPHKGRTDENEHTWRYYALWHGENGQLFAEEETRQESHKTPGRKYTYYGNDTVLILYHSKWSPCHCALNENEADWFADCLLNGFTRTHVLDFAELTETITDDVPMNWE